MAERDGYGVFVSTAASESQVYGLFRDDNNNSRFDSGEQIGEDYYLDPRFKIYQICDQSNACNLTSASISFHRPNFDARLYVGSTSKTRIDIVLAAVDDTSVTRTVSVYSSGQITVE
jgi:hypothetical protein